MSRADSSAPTQSSTQTTQRPPRLALLIATGFGLGYLPTAPGTAGSFLAVFLFAWIWIGPFYYYGLPAAAPDGTFSSLSPDLYVSAAMHNPLFQSVMFLLLGMNLLGPWASGKVSSHYGLRDPQFIVVDEVSGQIVTFVPLMFVNLNEVFGNALRGWFVNWQYLLAGFILFRVFDIWKPWPVRAAEKLPGGWGIMADDWVAGIYAALCLWGLRAAGM